MEKITLFSLAACEYISGPVIWPEQNIEVIWHCDGSGVDREWEFILQGEAVGGVFDWRKGFDLLDNPGLHTTLWYGGRSDKE